mgnify:CR=1 FL=1
MKNAEAFSSNDKILTPLKTLQELIRFVIPKGNKEMPTRIILALIFLSFQRNSLNLTILSINC